MKYSLLVLLFACAVTAMGQNITEGPDKLVPLSADDPKGTACGTSLYFRLTDWKKEKGVLYHREGKPAIVMPLGSVSRIVIRRSPGAPTIVSTAPSALKGDDHLQATWSTITMTEEDHDAAACLAKVAVYDER